MNDTLPRKYRAVQVYFPEGYNADAWHLAKILRGQGTTLGRELMTQSLYSLMDQYTVELMEARKPAL